MTSEEIKARIKEISLKIQPTKDKIAKLKESIQPEMDEIERLYAELEKNDINQLKAKLAEWVDRQFDSDKLDENDNPYDMILLREGNYTEDSRDFSVCYCQDLTDYKFLHHLTKWTREKYNKFAHPLPSIDADSEIFKAFNSILPEMVDDDESTNECWYKFTAVTKDHKIVEFVIRDDGMLLNENGEMEVIDTL